MKKAFSAATLALASILSASVGANTDVIIADINVKNGHLALTNGLNISQRSGYDNQPNFAPDNSGVYYTAMFELGKEKWQTDTLFYQFSNNKTKNITNTQSTSEYSPTPYNNGERLSFIKVEENGDQRLWSLSLGSGQQQLVNQNIKPVGYHAWGQNQDLALFVLGEPMTLQYVETANQAQGKIVAGDVGRSIRYNQKRNIFTFSQGLSQQQLSSFDPITGKAKNHLALPRASEYYTWLDQDHLLSAKGSMIYIWQFDSENVGWTPWADASQLCSTQITRMNVNHDQTKIALVCDETKKS